MSWSNLEKAAVKMAQKALDWDRPTYEMILRNIAGVRAYGGKISAANPGNTDGGFVRFMAFAERSGYIDPKHGEGFWLAEAAKTCPRLHHRIQEIAAAGQSAGIFQDSAAVLASFIERQTSGRPGGPTRTLADCDFEWSYKVLEGLKAWLRREFQTRGLPFNF